MSNMDIRFSPSSPPPATDAGRSGCSAAPPDGEASDRFLRALEDDGRRNDLESGQSRHGGASEDGENMPSPFSLSGMSSPLNSIFSGRMEQTAPVPPALELDESRLEQLVERILVSTPEQGGNEVRLSLGSQALPGTEIIIRRDAGGMLSVALNTTDQASFQTLVSARDELKRLLEAQERSGVRVDVNSGADAEDNDSRRRSRGYVTEELPEP